MTGAYEQLGVLTVIAGLSKQHTANAGTLFCRQFVVTHIVAPFRLSRRKNSKNAAKTEDYGMNTCTKNSEAHWFGTSFHDQTLSGLVLGDRLACDVLRNVRPINSIELLF